MQKNNTKKLVFTALMVSMSIIIGIICKTYFTVSPIIRVTFDNMPIILIGILLGPVYSTMAAIGTDLISALIAGYAPTPLITVGAAAIGIIAGLMPRYIFIKKNFATILITSLSAHAVGSVLIKTYALADLYNLDFLPTFWARLPLYIVIGAAEAYLIYNIYKNRRLVSAFESKGTK